MEQDTATHKCAKCGNGTIYVPAEGKKMPKSIPCRCGRKLKAA